MRQVSDRLNGLIEPIVSGLGYEYVGAEIDTPPGRYILRVFIDSADGVGLDDCAKVSHQVNGMLEVENPIKDDYELEVSSPGMDRPLFTLEHFKRFVGAAAEIKMFEAVDGSRNFKCVISRIEEGDVIVERDGDLFRLPMRGIRKARLMPDFNNSKKG